MIDTSIGWDLIVTWVVQTWTLKIHVFSSWRNLVSSKASRFSLQNAPSADFPLSIVMVTIPGLHQYRAIQLFSPAFCVNHLLVHTMPSSNETSCPKWPRMPTASSPDFISQRPLQSGPVLRIHAPLSSKRTRAYVALRQSLLASSSKPCSCGSLVWLAFSSNLFDMHTSSKVELDLINSMRVFLETWVLPLTTLALSSFFHLLSSVFCLVLQCLWMLHTCVFLFLNCNESSLWKVSTTFIFFPCCSVTQSCPALCNPMDWSMPGFRVHRYFLELAQTHVHPFGDAIQPSHSLSFPSPAFSLSQHQGLFQWVHSSHQVVKVLEL